MSIKYTNPEWGMLIVQELKARGMSKEELAKRMGKTGGAVRMLLKRKTITLANVRALSKGMGKDYVELLLSEESKATLDKVRMTGFHPGESVIQEQIDLEVKKVRQEKLEVEEREKALQKQIDDLNLELAAEKTKLDEMGVGLKAQEDEITGFMESMAESYTELRELKGTLELERGKLDKLIEEHQIELSEKDMVIDKLRGEKTELEFDTKLKVSVLEAKLEVLQTG